MNDILGYCESQLDWIVDTVLTLVRHESPSDDKIAVDRCGMALEAQLRAIGATVDRLTNATRGNHLKAEFAGSPYATGQILILGHLDTVWPVGQLAGMPVREADGRLYGPGIFDMKAGIAVAMLAVRALRHLRLEGPRVVMLWTADEEVGSGTSRALVEMEARRSSAVLVMEPSLPGGAAKTSRKGCGDYELVVRGVAAHAGLDPGKGASAILELAHQIIAIQALQDLPRGITVNVGVIAGGSRPNVVAAEGRARIDVRVPRAADALEIERGLRQLAPRVPGTTLEISGGIDRPPLERSEAGARLFDIARAVAGQLGQDLGEGAAGGGSDGNFTAAAGVPTLDGLGPRGDGAHAQHEHVLMADLPWRAALMCGLLVRLHAIQKVD